MRDRDPVDVDLDRYLDSIDPDYVSPEDRERDRQEYLADQEEYDSVWD